MLFLFGFSNELARVINGFGRTRLVTITSFVSSYLIMVPVVYYLTQHYWFSLKGV